MSNVVAPGDNSSRAFLADWRATCDGADCKSAPPWTGLVTYIEVALA
jgi:hypothetical protein